MIYHFVKDIIYSEIKNTPKNALGASGAHLGAPGVHLGAQGAHSGPHLPPPQDERVPPPPQDKRVPPPPQDKIVPPSPPQNERMPPPPQYREAYQPEPTPAIGATYTLMHQNGQTLDIMYHHPFTMMISEPTGTFDLYLIINFRRK